MSKLNIEELKALIVDNKIDTIVLGFTDHYGRLMGKRLEANFFLEDALNDGSHACDYLLTTDMEMNPVPGYTFANWELGYGDFHMVPDLEQIYQATWLRKTAMVICQLKNTIDHRAISVSPRAMLQHQLSRLEAEGFSAKGASELEYFLYQDSYEDAFHKPHNSLKSAGWYREDYHIFQGSRTERYHAAVRRHLRNSGITVEGTKGEWGIGQHEINIKYTDCLQMADRHILLKQCMKEIADRIGMSVTFMAKPHNDQAGSSCHIHLSLWQDDANMFSGDHAYGDIRCSKEFIWFLGGWMKYVNDVMVFFAPTINSYKRYISGSWAPTRLAWSRDNRTAGFRIVGSGNSLRIECRIPGADSNPYLVFAASLACGLEGIQNQIEPPDLFDGDIYAAIELPRVPYTLNESVQLFRQSTFCKKVFGEEVVNHYTHFYQNEVNAFQSSVTDWEHKRYFERI